MNEFSTIGAEVSRHEDKVVAEKFDDARARDAFVAGAAHLVGRSSGRSFVRLSWAISAASAIAAVALLWVFWPGTAGDSRPSEQWVRVAEGQSRTVAFPDGSRLVLNNGAHARIRSVDVNTRTIVLESGAAELRVKHTDKTDWQVLAGPFTVKVVGTKFLVSWKPEEERFSLELREGEVSVSGPLIEEGQRVRSGHRLVAVVSEEHVEFGRVDEKPVETSAETSSTVAPEKVKSPAPSDPKKRSGKDRATASSPEDLLLRADSARLAGNTAEAVKVYVQLRKQYAGSGHAATAAFNLGRMAFDQQRDYRGASHWFEVYLSEQKSGTLRREALGRLMEAQAASGMKAPAQKTATEYLAKYPKGPHATRAREISLE